MHELLRVLSLARLRPRGSATAATSGPARGRRVLSERGGVAVLDDDRGVAPTSAAPRGRWRRGPGARAPWRWRAVRARLLRRDRAAPGHALSPARRRLRPAARGRRALRARRAALRARRPTCCPRRRAAPRRAAHARGRLAPRPVPLRRADPRALPLRRRLRVRRGRRVRARTQRAVRDWPRRVRRVANVVSKADAAARRDPRRAAAGCHPGGRLAQVDVGGGAAILTLSQ